MKLLAIHRRDIFLLIIVTICYGMVYPMAVHGSSIAEEYSGDSDFSIGSLVSVQKESPDTLEQASLINEQYLLGVVQAPESNLITISKGLSDTTVAISGEVDTLVSDLNGEINKGDLVGISWIEGVGMKFSDVYGKKVVGVALEDFIDTNAKSYNNIDTPNGNKSAKVGYISMKLMEGQPYASDISKSGGATGFVRSLAGKSVSSLRVFAGTVAFSISVIVAGIFIYSSIKHSFISFGRNPLASNSIYGGLVQVSSMSVGIVLLGSAVAYIIWVV